MQCLGPRRGTTLHRDGHGAATNASSPSGLPFIGFSAVHCSTFPGTEVVYLSFKFQERFAVVSNVCARGRQASMACAERVQRYRRLAQSAVEQAQKHGGEIGLSYLHLAEQWGSLQNLLKLQNGNGWVVRNTSASRDTLRHVTKVASVTQRDISGAVTESSTRMNTGFSPKRRQILKKLTSLRCAARVRTAFA
jgi:hypothetical protein